MKPIPFKLLYAFVVRKFCWHKTLSARPILSLSKTNVKKTMGNSSWAEMLKRPNVYLNLKQNFNYMTFTNNKVYTNSIDGKQVRKFLSFYVTSEEEKYLVFQILMPTNS
jgi:hypothetical protein